MKKNEVLFSPDEADALHRTKIWVKDFFLKEEGNGIISGGHGFDHNKRVAGMAALLSRLENKKAFLPVLTSLIFDIGRTSRDPRANSYQHGEISRELSNDFINCIKILSKKDREIVKNAIEDHPKRNENVRKNYVVKIVMDADRLDAFGALGVVRIAAHRWRLPIFDEDIDLSTSDSGIKTIYQDFAFRIPEFYGMLWTDSARRIAKSWFMFTKKFTKEYEKQALFMHKTFKDLKI